MEEIPEWNSFVPVPYRKPDIDQQASAPAVGRKNRKNRSQNAASIKVPPLSESSSSNPFTDIFRKSEPTVTPDDLTEDERQQYEAMLRMEEEEAKAMNSSRKKEKEKWTPLFTAHGNDLQIKLPGRHPCQCMCTKHDLIHNCTNCGRIVCEQEGSGPCLTCGHIVCTPEEMGILRKGGLEAEKLQRRIFGGDKVTLDLASLLKVNSDEEDKNVARAKAEAHRDTLLDYDRTTAQRTRIIDDQADYFSENPFHTPEQRRALREREEELRKKRFESKRDKNRKFNLDLAGRELRQQEDIIDNMYSQPEDQFSASGSDNTRIFERLEYDTELSTQSSDTWSLDKELSTIPLQPNKLSKTENALHRLRVQDHELQEMSDGGMALSIMQPWASFVVMGLKPHEGRNWYTSHRGKLWIVSGSKILPPSEIVQEENILKALTGNELLVFPVQYQTGFLLGWVDLVDCISQEEYQKRFPGALLKHPYILIFENPRELDRTFPVEGKLNIFKLDYRLHEVAKRQGCKKPETVWLPESTYGSRFRDEDEGSSLDSRVR